LKGASSLFKRK